MSAEVRVQLRPPDQSALREVGTIRGTIRGPFSDFAHTLPFTVPLHLDGPNDLRATVPDPCYWSPGAPYRYELELSGADLVVGDPITFGMRRFGARGRDLLLDGRRWVARAVDRSIVASDGVSAWREHHTCMLLDGNELAEIEIASAAGVMVIARLLPDENVLPACLSAMQRQPAVAMVSIGSTNITADDLHSLAPNILRLQEFHPDEQAAPADWAQGLIVDASSCSDVGQFSRLKSYNKPILAATQTDHRRCLLLKARSECDELQRRLAQASLLAGYIVA